MYAEGLVHVVMQAEKFSDPPVYKLDAQGGCWGQFQSNPKVLRTRKTNGANPSPRTREDLCPC